MDQARKTNDSVGELSQAAARIGDVVEVREKGKQMGLVLEAIKSQVAELVPEELSEGARNRVIGEIYRRFEKAGLRIVAAKMVHLSREQAEGFYAVHKERPFFNDLVGFMISGPVMIQVLEGENAIALNREIMGATDPSKAAENTLRKLYAKSIGENTVHGSDAPETAAFEISWFFPQNQVFTKK